MYLKVLLSGCPHAQAASVTAPKTAAADPLPEAHAPDPGHADTDSTPGASTVTAAASAALSCKRRKSNAAVASAADSDETPAADDETAVDATDDEDMQEAGEEDEVKSPVKAIDSSAAGSSRVEAADVKEKATKSAVRKKGLVLAKAAGTAFSLLNVAVLPMWFPCCKGCCGVVTDGLLHGDLLSKRTQYGWQLVDLCDLLHVPRTMC